MATCWQEVVAKEVKQCLVRCDLSIQPCLLVKPHPLVRELVWLYNRLQHATMELFGGHSWFVVAMKEGFSRVIQSMDEVSGVRVRRREQNVLVWDKERNWRMERERGWR